MSTTPNFPGTPISTAVAVSATANTSRASTVGVPANSVAVSPVAANGARVDQINVNGLGTTVAGIIIIWHYDGTNSVPILEIPVTAVTPSTTAAAFATSVVPPNALLGANCRLYATSTVASQLAAVGMYGGAF